MKILYAISAANFCLLLWVAVTLSRHIRRFRESERRQAIEQEAQSSRPMHTVQKEQDEQPTLDAQTAAQTEAQTPATQPKLPDGNRRIRPDRRHPGGTLYAPGHEGLYAAHKAGPVSVAPDLAQSRKIRYASTGRLDPAYFNKDAGDLTDPEAPVKTRADGSKPARRY